MSEAQMRAAIDTAWRLEGLDDIGELGATMVATGVAV
jgi:hypothetical protein